MEFDPQQLDEETEFVLDKFREGYTTLDVKIMIKNFVDSRVQQSFVQIQSLNYKNAYLIYKKIEKVLTISLRNFGKFADTLPFYKDIAIYILDTQINLKPGDKLTLLKTPIDLVQQSNSEINELYFFIIRNLIQALNNLGVIYVLRNKFNEAQQSFLRAIQSRSFLIENYLSIYQFSLLLKNLAFLFLQLQQNDDAAQFLNKGILGLEILSNPQLEIQEISINYKIMLNLIEIFYSKKDIKLLPEPREIQKERMVHLLALSYSYYGDLLEKLEKKQQAKFCKDQYQFLQDLFIKMYPRGLLKQQIETKKALEIDENIEIAKHQADQIKNKSIKDDTSNVTVKSAYTGVSSNPPDIKEDQIIFQKYIQLQNQRYKIIILQYEEFIQIIMYSKPLNVLKKIKILFSELEVYQKANYPNAFNDEQNLQEFLKQLIKKLYVKGDELHMRDIKYIRI
ncbi:hypothetical protein pb186bvf_008350 [Paramecium bursaria]